MSVQINSHGSIFCSSDQYLTMPRQYIPLSAKLLHCLNYQGNKIRIRVAVGKSKIQFIYNFQDPPSN